MKWVNKTGKSWANRTDHNLKSLTFLGEHSLGKGEVVSSILTGSTTSRADHGASSHQLKPNTAEFDAGIRDRITALLRALFDAVPIGGLDHQRA